MIRPALLALALLSPSPVLQEADRDAVPDPVDGAPGIGDPYFPELGNGGYDVAHYDLRLDVDPEGNTIDGEAALEAKAEVALATFHLDLMGMEVERVLVDGDEAEFRREGSELEIEPATPIEAEARFRVVVEYSGTPTTREVPGLPLQVGWKHYEDRVFTLSQPWGSMTWYPVNDHPRDKATYDFYVTVPDPYDVAANGVLVSKEAAGEGRTTFHFRSSARMASYLTTVNVAPFDVVEKEGPDGIPLTFYFPEETPEDARSDFDRTAEMIEALSIWFGPYPFESYGGLLMNESFGAALETQTLPIYGGARAGESVQIHELAHQWFGNSVSVDTWQDLWLSESFASYATWLWIEREQGTDALERRIRAQFPALCSAGDQLVADPGADGLFGVGVYVRGPMALHALRLEIGDHAFFGLLRDWTARHAGSTATTEEFLALAEEHAERDLDRFFEEWLFEREMPGIEALGLECEEEGSARREG